MEEVLEIPKWIEKIMTLWLKDAAKPLPKELRDVWREVHKRKAEQLRQIDREKLTGWQRLASKSLIGPQAHSVFFTVWGLRDRSIRVLPPRRSHTIGL